MKSFWILTIICLLTETVDSRAVEDVTSESQRDKRQRRFSVEELLIAKFPHIITGDLDIDICKADGFYGDIALPNIRYDTEWREQKLNKSYLEELNKYREEILKEGLQVEEEGLTEILQFKNQHDANKQVLGEHDKVFIQEKPIMVDRNQYNMDGKSADGFRSNARNDDTNPAVKDVGFEFRLESSTQVSKKRRRRPSHHRQLSRTESTKARQQSIDNDTFLEFPTSTNLSTDTSKYIDYADSIKETSIVQIKMRTRGLSSRRHRCHHRRSTRCLPLAPLARASTSKYRQ